MKNKEFKPVSEKHSNAMYKVLIVEDDPMVAMINEQYIKRNKNFQLVGKCKDGAAALEFLAQNSVDLIVLDVYMLHMDGLETLRTIRNRQIPVDAIMFTAANDRNSVEEALHLGIVDYLVKPFTFDRFQMALEKYISQSNAFRDFDTLNQKNIDHIIDNSRKKNEDTYPKGIQKNLTSHYGIPKGQCRHLFYRRRDCRTCGTDRSDCTQIYELPCRIRTCNSRNEL